MKNILPLIVLAVLSISCESCSKSSDHIDEYATADTTGTLKGSASYDIGTGVRLNLFRDDPAYLSLVKTQFDMITFENELKHSALVTDAGVNSFTRSDEFVNLAQAAGLKIHGHALVGFQGNNAAYLYSLRSPTTEVNAMLNSGFETGSGNNFNNWTTQVGPGAAGNFEAISTGVVEGSRAMKVTVTTPGAEQYTMQAYSDLFPIQPGSSYTLSFYAKADANNSRFKTVMQNTTYQEKTFFLTTSWQKYTWTFQANESWLSLKFHFPAAGTFYFDDITLPRPTSGMFNIDRPRLETSMRDFITATVTRYKGKIASWDVVNEPLEDNTGALRIKPRTEVLNNEKFYWAEHLGKDYIANAFRYANTADPNAMLYLNENNVESDETKLNALVQLVNELKTQGVPIHGIGLQMHLTLQNDKNGIERALQRLAASGLKIRISEMDIRMNPFNAANFQPSNDQLIAQRDLYRFVVDAYHKHVPAPQRAGITVWDFSDKHSWIVVTQGKQDNPTLFDGNYGKKPAYYGFLVGLKKN
jgi:endo-1,4-beta-xylanase